MYYLDTLAGLIIAVITAAAALAGPANAQTPRDLVARSANANTTAVDHRAWDGLLKTYVIPGADGLNRVDYGAFKKDGRDALKKYLLTLNRVDLATLGRQEQFAFLANLYNAKTIDIVLDHYPVKSIKDISLGGGLFATFTGGPWKAKVLTIGGVSLSLDDIEHEILRKSFKDPRVHYAVNCASVGCPNLGTEAFTGARLDQQLDAAARAYINSPRGVTASGTSLQVSSIYEWFKADFGGDDAGVLRHLQTYAEPSLLARIKSIGRISNHNYDWRLNDGARGRSQ